MLGKACFLQKSDVPGFIQDLILATEKGLRNTEEGLEQVPGYPLWKYKPMDGMQGCPAEIWRYVDELNLAQLRGISWEGFDYLLEEFDLDMPQPASRKIFSGVEGGVEKGFVQAPHIMRTIEQIQTKYRPISLSGFTKLLKQSGITLPRRVIESLFNELDDITLKIGATEEFICQDLVNLNDLGPLVEKYLSGGMWFLGLPFQTIGLFLVGVPFSFGGGAWGKTIYSTYRSREMDPNANSCKETNMVCFCSYVLLTTKKPLIAND